MAPMSLPPGFRFHPTDEELIAYYLDRKISGHTIELEIIPEVDLYKCEPWDLPEKSYIGSKDMEWYFYSPRDKKYPNGTRTNRATRGGYWKATGKDREVQTTSSQKKAVGMKKTLVYYRGRAPHGIRTNWVMHEYRLLHSSLCAASSIFKDSYALCRVFKKTVQIPKTKEVKTIENTNKDNIDQMWVMEEELLGDGISGINEENSKERDAESNENVNNVDCSKFPSDTSSSDVSTQGTPMETAVADDLVHLPFASDEAHSTSANMYSMGVDFSNLIQDMQMANYSSLAYQFAYPPLELEDFPQINMTTETTKASNSEIIEEEYMIFDQYKDCMNGTFEEILSLCSSQDNSNITLSIQD